MSVLVDAKRAWHTHLGFLPKRLDRHQDYHAFVYVEIDLQMFYGKHPAIWQESHAAAKHCTQLYPGM